MARKMLSLFCAMSFVALAACGGTESGTDGTGKEDQSGKAAGGSSAQEAVKPSEPVELVFHTSTSDTEDTFNGLYGNMLKKKFPNYKIKFVQSKPGQTLPELLAQKQPVDVLYQSVSYYPTMVEASQLQYDMTDLAKKHNVDLSAFMPTLVDGIRNSNGGKLTALPVTNTVQVLYYNKGIFDQFGVSYPKDGMTWDETLDIAKKLTRKDGDKQYLGFASSPANMLGANQFSLPYLDPKTEKATYQDDGWKKLFDTLYVAPGEDPAYKSRVAALKALPYRLELTNSQELAMFAFHSQFPFAVPKDVEKIQWDLVSLPTFKEKPGLGSQMIPFVFGVASISTNKDAAMEVIKYLTSTEAQMLFSKQGIMPVINDDSVKKAFAQESQFKDKNWKSLFLNQPAPMAPKTKYQIMVEGALTKQLPEIVTGAVDLNTAMRTAAEAADKAVADEKLKQK
ncbi:ABC transporter substrate-binding protein [Paenibacillus hodogayensis]|uniref:ABC transporter substrate-binding protein n=1 Tax=Paenibacillus hodogayensis TaxID=279208 RepID=A0ABV5VV72_9BACL